MREGGAQSEIAKPKSASHGVTVRSSLPFRAWPSEDLPREAEWTNHIGPDHRWVWVHCAHEKKSRLSPTRPVMVRTTMKGRRRPNREVQSSEACPRSGCSQSDITGFARNTRDAVDDCQNWRRNGSITTSPEDHVNSTAAPMAEIATKVLSGGARCSTSCMAPGRPAVGSSEKCNKALRRDMYYRQSFFDYRQFY